MRVRLLRNFILYCVRNGLQGFNFFGSRISKELKSLEELVSKVKETITLDQLETGECKKYIEERKREKEGGSGDDCRLGKNKRGTVVDVIQYLIGEHNIKSYSEWELKIDIETKHQLLRDFGLQADTYASRIIKNNKNKEVSGFKYLNYQEIIYKVIEHDWAADLGPRTAQIEWIEYLFESNDLSLIEFFAWLECVKNMRYIKINGLVLEGHTNAGKSLIIDNTVGPLKPEEIPRERDNNGFHLDQLPFAACALFEEPMITPVNVGTWKLLLEGKQIKTDIKHRDKEGINRLPIFITTATPLTMNVDTKETEQINQRIKIFNFKSTISHRKELYTRTSYNTVRRAPGFIIPYDFIALYLINYEAIHHYIAEQDKDLQLNPDRLETPRIVQIEVDILSGVFKTRWDTIKQQRDHMRK